jgi:hypothetical protein
MLWLLLSKNTTDRVKYSNFQQSQKSDSFVNFGLKPNWILAEKRVTVKLLEATAANLKHGGSARETRGNASRLASLEQRTKL